MSLLPSETLVCVPTQLELNHLTEVAPDLLADPRWAHVAVVGFGPVAAAASTAALIAAHRPAHVLLIGIAGTYLQEEAIGTAVTFGSVSMDGVGAGEGSSTLSPRAMNFPQWSAPTGDQVFDHLPLTGEGPELLTVCAAADSPTMLATRRARFPHAVAEDMESFAVALAAKMAGLPTTTIRGLSNQAGNRDPSTWRIQDALAAAASQLHPLDG